MANCLNLKIPQVQKDLKELTGIFQDENIAYYLLSENGGHNLDLDVNGNPSDLFNDLQQRVIKRNKAIKDKALIFTPEFRSVVDWKGKGEPDADLVLEFKKNNSDNNANVTKYNSKDVITIAVKAARSVEAPINVNQLINAIKQGVAAFTMLPVNKLNTEESELRAHLLDKNFEYTERDNIGFYTRKLKETEEKKMKDNNTLNLNGVSIDLRKLGFNFGLTRDQFITVQEAADWIDGKELKQKSVSTYKGDITELKNREVFVFTADAKGVMDKGSSKKAVDLFGRIPGETFGFKAVKKGQQTYGVTNINHIKALYDFAANNPKGKFKVGVKNEKYAEYFADAGSIPENIIFEEEFSKQVYKRVPNRVKDNFLLTGYAGTGKTTVTSIIIEYAQQTLNNILASATTNRAVRVQEQIYRDRIDVGTLHSMLGLSPDTSVEEFDTKKLKFSPQNKPKVSGNSILIIDEASQINNDLYKFLQGHSSGEGYKILFIGDDRQLKPVKQSTTSRVFETSDKHISRLVTQVRQTKDNSLDDVLVKLRKSQKTNDKPLGTTRTSSINDKGTDGIEWVMGKGFSEHMKVVFKSDNFKNSADFAKVVAFKNDTISSYNKQIRNILGRTKEIEIGEVMMGYDNVSDFNKAIISNGADYVVKESKDIQREIVHPLYPKLKVKVHGIEVSLQDSLSEYASEIKTYILSSSNSEQVKIDLATMAYETLQEYFKVRSTNKKAAKAIYSKYKRFQNSFQTFENLTIPGIENASGGPITHKKKSIDYGYAITSHKSQGGTYQYVFVDEADIESIYKYDVEAANQSKYVSFSRAAKGVIAKTSYKITNNQKFNLEQQSENYSEELSISNVNNETMEALEKEGLIHKQCN